MKALKKRIVACLLAFCLALSLMACDLSQTTNETDESYAYIAIDINPSVELVMADGKVESVRAVNDDATVLLSGEDLTGLSAEEATEKIVALSEELGYLNEDNTDVKLTVIADDDQTASEIEEKAKNGAKKGSSLAIVNSSPRLSDERETKALREEDSELYKELSPAKLRLIKSLMEYDPEMTLEIGVTMSTKELISLLKEYSEEFKGIVGDELKAKFNERKEELKLEKQREIAEVYGEDFLDAWNKNEGLKELYKEIEDKAENAVLSEEDVEAILALIGEESAELIADENGSVTIESIENFFDRAFNKDFDEIEEQIEQILDKYDEDDYVLSEEDISRIVEIAGEAELERLEDIEALIDDAEDRLNRTKDEIELDTEQKAIIDGIKNDFDNIKDQVKEEFKTEIEKAKEHFEQKKADRLK